MTSSAPRPVAFMVMPFRRKPVPNPPPDGPAEVDFDALWDLAYAPALSQLGYSPVRADSEAGSVIIKDMLERLAFADLVLADMTIPNGNVYYEVGVRHVAQETNCVLISADWSRQLFDVDQMRSLRYPLKETSVTEASAPAIQQVLINSLEKMKAEKTPFHALVTKPRDSAVFRQQLQELSDFQARLRAVRITASRELRQQKVRELIALPPASLGIREIAFELLTLVRDNLDWQDALSFIERLPPTLKDDPFTREQALLAQSKRGEHELAIAGLQELIGLCGETPERLGLIGGRYKTLWRDQRDGRLQRGEPKPGLRELGYLDEAIDHYRRGALLNLNAYYCACNLPLLLRSRATGHDLEEAAFFERLTVLVCELTIDRGQDDGWTRSTLLGSAIRSGDVETVQRLALAVAREGPAAWQLESTLADAQDALASLPDSEGRQQLLSVIEQLRTLLNPDDPHRQ
jgi:tetratricopeptide (TPR) repeat protein